MGSENCDDGNWFNGDGCSEVCKQESGWHYIDSGSCKFLSPICGDEIRAGDEECDIRHTPGCVNCRVATGWSCLATNKSCHVICGDNITVEPTEECDSTLGCSKQCYAKMGWNCSVNGYSSSCVPHCGDGMVITPYEECDSKDAGCQDCRKLRGYICEKDPCTELSPICGDGLVVAGELCDDLFNSTGCKDCQPREGWVCINGTCHVPCQDGIAVAGFENCDDPSLKNGCSPNCTTIPGWQCFIVNFISSCTTLCGNGVLNQNISGYPDEQCDQVSDGCVNCQVQKGWDCTSTCKTICGDGYIVPKYEMCDDGPPPPHRSPLPTPLTGVTSTDPDPSSKGGNGQTGGCIDCKEAPGWYCPPVQNTTCIAKKCGDFILAGAEQCDCNDTTCVNCTITRGYYTTSECSFTTKCGDSIVAGQEMCDLGSTEGTGCHNCTVSEGWKCNISVNQSSYCYTTCGDGLIATGWEDCDDNGTRNDDGCSSTCQIENGWSCRILSRAECPRETCCDLVSSCGDGKIVGKETCDIGLHESPGCINCSLTLGWNCTDQSCARQFAEMALLLGMRNVTLMEQLMDARIAERFLAGHVPPRLLVQQSVAMVSFVGKKRVTLETLLLMDVINVSYGEGGT
eukprot:TRINITY_DN7198_c0_g2_i1.p1 TRINITY_DN7198_c0_g2~~TRINITY_DN7198_c0_g2_i1.p1  ORF type:complete len:701 (-),score=140.71 TRINITY_DN7198_c0_g2_i1:332-2209(-)